MILAEILSRLCVAHTNKDLKGKYILMARQVEEGQVEQISALTSTETPRQPRSIALSR